MFIVKNLYHQYGNDLVIDNINMQIETGKITAIVGPSGCGKTTLLKIFAGVLKPTKGELINFNKSSSYVFQEPRLLPWCTVYENIKFVLQDKLPINHIDQEVNNALEMVELMNVKDHYPLKLSGGMQQRVAIARALALPSKLMFLDEPFQSLDFELKQRLMKELLPLLDKGKYNVFLVTHDIRVAATMGDNVLILSNRPCTVLKNLVNPIERSIRISNNGSLLSFENSIYGCLANSTF